MATRKPKYDKQAVKDAARNRWGEILASAGVGPEFLTGTHGPCPKCQGTDRWRVFDDFNETGGAICNQCGRDLGDGFAVLQWLLGIPFPDALAKVADHLGIEPQATKAKDTKGGKKAESGDPAKELEFIEWDEALAATWCTLHKPGITPAAMLLAGCRLAKQKDHSGEVNGIKVFAIPVWGEHLQPVGYVLYHVGGGHLPVKGGKLVKCKATKDCGAGWIGPVERLTEAHVVWKVEGLTDLLAMLSLELPQGVIVISNAFGAGEKPMPWMQESVTDKIVYVVHDADTPGENGAAGYEKPGGIYRPGWVKLLAVRAKECCHVRLPYEVKPDHGPDTRCFILEGHGYGDFVRLAESSTPTAAAGVRPNVHLPGSSHTITEVAATFGDLLGTSGRFIAYGGVPMRRSQQPDGEWLMSPVRPAALCSDIERVAYLVKTVPVDGGGFEEVPVTCPEGVARLILASEAFVEALPQVDLLTRCPVLIERNGKLLQVAGYDPESRIFADGDLAVDVPLTEAVELLNGMNAEFIYTTPADRARALGATMTPALIQGGILGGRAPLTLIEALESQSGKGYKNKSDAAVYRAKPWTVTQRPKGGVGDMLESFDTGVASGAGFIDIDNVRNSIEIQAIESFLTENSYTARVPYSPPVAIDPRRRIIRLTSNKAAVTVDLANRSSCIRLRKQRPGYEFKSFTEGDLIAHIEANQPLYLGSVFSVIREWHRQGKPRLSGVQHDFRQWASIVGWIVKHVLKAGDMLEGHREAQQRISTPGLNWLRDVAVAVNKAGRSGKWLRPNQLLQITADHGVATPGIDAGADLDEGDEWLKCSRKIGVKLSHAFCDETTTVDGMLIERRKERDENYRLQTEYRFATPDADTPEPEPPKSTTPEPVQNSDGFSSQSFEQMRIDASCDKANPRTSTSGAPNSTPEVKPATPEPPEPVSKKVAETVSSDVLGGNICVSDSAIERVALVQGVRGSSPIKCTKCNSGEFVADPDQGTGWTRVDCADCGHTLDNFDDAELTALFGEQEAVT